MNLGNFSTSRAMKALTGVAATSLAVAGLSLMSTPSDAAPAAAPAAAPSPVTKGYAGAPANPTPYKLTQPDGSTLRVHGFGDHLSHGVATVKGNNTIVKGSDGYWRYAAGLTAAGKLKPSSVVAGQGPAPAAAQNLAPTPSAVPTPSKAPMGGTGNDHELVILAQFTDVVHHASGSSEADWANHYFGATGSVDNFYDEASVHQFGLKPATENCGTTPNDGVTGWITLPMAHPNTGVDPNASEQYVADAIKATESCVDYASFDTAPADGQIETNELHVTIIGAGFETSYGGDECGQSIWGHEWDLNSAGITPPTVDGKTIGASGYTTFGEWHCNSGDTPGHKATMGIMAHEFGHDINWPDLYDTDLSGEGIGEWSLMSGGSWGENAAPGHEPGNSPAWPDAWAQYYQGWITPVAVTSATNDITLAPHQALLLDPNAGGSNWLFNETEGDGEYYLVENRNHTGYDISTPSCGLIVYRIDETVTPSNSANANYADPLVKVIQADGLNGLNVAGNRGDAGDPYPGSTNNHDLTDVTNPNSKFHDGTASNLALHVDSTAGCLATEQVDVTTPGIASPPVIRPDNDMFAGAITAVGASGTATKNTQHATVETGEPKPAGAGRASVWYNWTAPANGVATIQTTGSNFDTVLGLYTGSAVNALTEVASNDDQTPGSVFTSKVTTHVTGGTTYRIAADGYGGDSGNLSLAWSLAPTVAPTATAVHSPEPSTFGSASSVVVNVSGTAGTATGTVTLKEGATTIGSGALNGSGQATIALPGTTPVGAHSLTASYPGDTHYDPATANVTATVVAAAPPAKISTSTTASAPKKVKFKKNFDVKATVAGVGGTATGTVQVLDGSKVIGTGTLANGVVTIHITKNLKSGKHTLAVTYSGSATANASQTTVKVKVLKKKKHPHH